MTKPRLRLLSLPALVAALPAALSLGGCLLSAEADLPEVEVSNHDLSIPAAPLDTEGSDVAVTVTFKQKPARAGIAKSAFSNVHTLGFTIDAKSGVTDLSFLHSLRITATSAEAMAAGQAPIEIAHYDRLEGDQTPIGTELKADSHPPEDVTPLWQSSEVIFDIVAVGQMPTVAWTADVGLRFGATLSY